FPDGHPDRFHAIRPWFGYGPETLVGVLPQHFSYPHPAPVLETHFHNLVWDTWASVGGLGVCSLLLVYSSLFFYAFRGFGWIRTPWHVAWYWISQPALALVGWFALASWRGAAFAGLGLQAGLVLA